MSRTTVLAYHAVGDCDRADDVHNLFVSSAAFEAQMAWLARHRDVVSLEDAVRGRSGSRPAVAITFDDGYANVLRNAAPILRAHSFPATIFVPTGAVGDRNRWDPPSPCSLEIMDRDQLLQIEAAGVTVESHGHAHVLLSGAGYEEAHAELASAVHAFRQLLGRSPRFLAFPYTHGSPEARRAAADLGFEAAFSIDRPGTGTYDWQRVQITPLDRPWLFRLKTSGRYLSIRHDPVVQRIYRASRGALRQGRRAAAFGGSRRRSSTH